MHSPISSVETLAGIVLESILKILHPVFTPNRCACVPLLGSFTMHRPAHTSPTLPFLNFPMICSLFFIFFVKKKSLRKFETFFEKSNHHTFEKEISKICHSEKEGYIFPVRQVLWLNLTVRLIFLVFTYQHLHTRIHPLSWISLFVRTTTDTERRRYRNGVDRNFGRSSSYRHIKKFWSVW